MKRTSEEQLTKDTANASDAQIDADDSQEFERAPPEVLATRRILKARRTPNLKPPGPSNPAPNPFAALSNPAAVSTENGSPPSQETHPRKQDNGEAPAHPGADAGSTTENPTESAEKTTEALEKPSEPTEKPFKAATEAPGSAEPTKEVEPASMPAPIEEQSKDNSTTLASGQPRAEKEAKPASESAGNSSKGEDHKSETTKSEAPKPEVPASDVSEPDGSKSDAPKPAGSTLDLPKPVASASGAPGDKPSAEAPSSNTKTTEAVGEERKPPHLPSEAPQPTPLPLKGFGNTANGGPKPAVIFGAGTTTSPLTFASAAKSDGASFNVTPATTSVTEEKKPEFKEATVQTGEEDDEELFRTRAKLFTLETEEKSSRWKERGVGPLKVNRNTQSGKVRLLMRTDATLRVVLNTPLYPEFKLDRASDRSIRFQGFDVDDHKKRTSYLARFSTRHVSKEMVAAVKKCIRDLKSA